MKRILSLLIAVLMVLGISGCAQTEPAPEEPQKQKFTKSFIDYFDTASTIVGYDYSQEEFDANCAIIEEELRNYHELYDIYNSYEGVNNLYYLNREAGKAPVEVDEDIIALFDFGREMYDLTKGKTNYAMGAVLRIWHDYREAGNYDYFSAEVPPMEMLEKASEHCDINDIIIDRENSTVFFADPDMKVDVGAIGKGYATEMIAQILEEKGVDNYTLNIGGNIRTIGTKGDGTGWIAGIQNPDLTSEQGFLLRVNFSDLALVTSGSYQRYYYVGETKYHHIIDPETLFPKDNFAAVSILTPNSGVADAISTACFNLSLEEGLEIIESMENTEAMWVEPDGTTHFSSGFEKFIQPDA